MRYHQNDRSIPRLRVRKLSVFGHGEQSRMMQFMHHGFFRGAGGGHGSGRELDSQVVAGGCVFDKEIEEELESRGCRWRCRPVGSDPTVMP
mmetsp:Transcript_13153/g.27936  ORF Transcript_13153/g.27936 Transcript_13153/m.27936 type:complete len:91 (+) Transcript_13153:669-941(+)